ncbi:MAG: tetratricopeptide repeat protein [Bacteroidales bacterium]|nr:tetratricopeptide repeat protein [Bacteroidales bacterium]
MNRKRSSDNRSSGRELLFKLIMVVLPVLILLLFEGVLRIAGYGDRLDLFITNPVEGYEKYLIVNPEIGKKYFQKFEYTAPANDIFLKEKPESTFRIFVMGSSVVYGFPYERNLMFSRIMQQRLDEAYPGRSIEVVNTAITAINSFTLLDFMDEILKQEPDAILIYAGHNEFYGAFGIGSHETMSRNRFLTRLHIAFMDSRIYQLIRNAVSATARSIAGDREGGVHGTLMKRVVKNSDILLYSEEYNVAMKRYRQNMEAILKKAGKRKIPVFIGELVSNIHGMEPFNSIPAETLEAAIDVFRKARAAEKNGDFEEALELYYRAKDLDCIRFRASEDVNRMINTLSEDYHAYMVPLLKVFQDHSARRFIGNNLMTEHVHPNVDGNFLMAETFFDCIVQSGILGKPDQTRSHTAEYFRRNYGYTALDTLLAYHRVRNLKGYWPFVMDEQEGYDYRITYRPGSHTDSLAFSVMKDPGLQLADVRPDLARRYERSGQIFEAYCEYEALLRMNPYIAVNYRDAATCLLKMEDLPPALMYFQKSLEYEESFYACFRMGEIYLIMGDYSSAIRYFEKAFHLAPEENKINVAAKLYTACVYAGKTKQAGDLASELRRANAAGYLDIPPKHYVFSNYIPFQTRDRVVQAMQMVREDREEEALALLESSLQTYDSHMANRMIGEIYLKQGDREKALDYLNKVYEHFRFDPGFLHHFVLLYLADKDIENARRNLEEIRRLDPDYAHLELLTAMLSQLH